MNIFINNIAHSQINGPGNRLVIWVQGCPFRCQGCFNPETHAMGIGTKMNINELVTLINEDRTIGGITISGGEPLIYAKVLQRVLKRIDKRLTRILFTGFDINSIISDNVKMNVVKNVDITISGLYDYKLPHPFLGKKFIVTTNRIPLDYFKPYYKIEYTIDSNNQVTKTGIFK